MLNSKSKKIFFLLTGVSVIIILAFSILLKVYPELFLGDLTVEMSAKTATQIVDQNSDILSPQEIARQKDFDHSSEQPEDFLTKETFSELLQQNKERPPFEWADPKEDICPLELDLYHQTINDFLEIFEQTATIDEEIPPPVQAQTIIQSMQRKKEAIRQYIECAQEFINNNEIPVCNSCLTSQEILNNLAVEQIVIEKVVIDLEQVPTDNQTEIFQENLNHLKLYLKESSTLKTQLKNFQENCLIKSVNEKGCYSKK